jgi:hypothetical protein
MVRGRGPGATTPAGGGGEEEEEEIHPYTMEDDELVESGTPLSTHIGVASPPSSIDVRPGPSASSSRPGKQPLIFSRKRGRGH